MDGSGVLSTEGIWLRGTIRNDWEAVRRSEALVSDENLVPLVDSAFSLAVEARFSRACDLADITRQMLGIRQRYGRGRVPPIVLMEMVVRQELGERVPIDDLSVSKTSVIKMLVLEQIVYDLGLFGEEVDELIMRAEDSRRSCEGG